MPTRPSPQQTESTHQDLNPRIPEPQTASQRLAKLTPPAALIKRAAAEPRSLTRAGALQLHRTIGNRAVSKLLGGRGRLPVQTKLVVSKAGDKYEQEADRVAKHVAGPISPSAKGEVQTKLATPHHIGEGGVPVSADVEAAIHKARSSGQAIPQHVRAPMEQTLGADFSSVRVHSGAQAHELNRSLSARAFTTGQDIFFRQGEYNPGSSAGREVLAHELTHVVQQQGAVSLASRPSTSLANSPTAIQRKFLFTADIKDKELTEAKEGDLETLTQALTADKAIASFQKLEAATESFKTSKFDKGTLTEKLDDKKTFAKAFTAPLLTMIKSESDFGVFDLSNEQHLGLLYYTLRRLMQVEQKAKKSETYTPEGKTEAEPYSIHEEQTSLAREKKWKEIKEKSKVSGQIYHTAFLGRGTSTAYYISTLGASHDFSESIIIGADDPWKWERGPGVLGHPMHMITPMRHFIGVTSDTQVSDIWAARAELAKLTRKVIEKAVPAERRIDSTVTNVDKEDGLYKVDYKEGTGLKTIYAHEVISGIGSGKHTVPKDIEEAHHLTHTDIPAPEMQIAPQELTKRIMNMDVFTRIAGRLYKGDGGKIYIAKEETTPKDRKEIQVILSGGNAGVDVAFDALNKGYTVEWITGNRGAAVLPGFFNYATIIPYLKAIKGQVSASSATKLPDEVTQFIDQTYAMYSGEQDRKSVAAKPMAEKIDAILKAAPDTIDKMYKGQGVSPENNFKNKEFKNVRFGRAETPTQDGSGKVTCKVDQKGIKTDVSSDILVYAQGQNASTLDVFSESIQKDLQPMLNRSYFKSKQAEPGPVSTLSTTDERLKIIGASAYRFYEPLKKKTTKKDLWDASEMTTAEKIDPVIASLPHNVLLNDQLTAILAEIEAANSFVAYNANVAANFVIGDQNSLRIYVSEQCPQLPITEADELVELIIKSRRHDTQPLAVPPTQVLFQKAWQSAIQEAKAKGVKYAADIHEEFRKKFDKNTATNRGWWETVIKVGAGAVFASVVGIALYKLAMNTKS